MEDTEAQLTLFDELCRSISTERLGTYLRDAGFDKERPLRLYLWNAYAGEAFHLPVQAVEVALRNCVNIGLCARFSENSWE